MDQPSPSSARHTEHQSANNTPNSELGVDRGVSKVRTACSELAKRSYACLEKNPGNNGVCQGKRPQKFIWQNV